MTLFADFNPNVSVPFSRVRQLFEDSALQAGVVGATDFKVAQRGAGANMSVDVPAGQAWVEVTTGTRNGLAHIVNDATANIAVGASHATLPRIDQAVLQYNDSSIPVGSGDVPTLTVLAGTATSGATLDNRTGAAALGNDRLRLADILVPAASTSVTTANIRDRRPWARGAKTLITRNANAAAGSDYTTTSTGAAAAIDATNLSPRIECSGVLIRMTLRGEWTHSVTGGGGIFVMHIDGAAVDGGANATPKATSAGLDEPLNFTWETTPAAGSHVIRPAFASTTAGTTTLRAAAAIPMQWSVEEIVRPNASNT